MKNKIKNKFSWINKNTVRIKFRMLIIRSVFLQESFLNNESDLDVNFYQIIYQMKQTIF